MSPLLVRSNFYVEAAARDAFFEAHPPTRVWFASLRLPLPHRYKWAGRRVSDNTARCRADAGRGAERARWRAVAACLPGDPLAAPGHIVWAAVKRCHDTAVSGLICWQHRKRSVCEQGARTDERAILATFVVAKLP